MYSSAELFFKYLKYYLGSSNGRGHGMHSPFVYRFIRNVLLDDKQYPEYAGVEQLRKSLLADHQVIEVPDLGAGSAKGLKNERKISQIAAASAKSPKYAKLLFRIARYYGCERTLELGTSLGISTAYLALANRGGKVWTIEGAPLVAQYAARNFQKLSLQNIQTNTGNFDDILAPVLKEMGRVDCCFIDGNHRREPTLRYFKECIPLTHIGSVIILDDIHWSPEMEEAWKEIRNHPAVKCSIDLFFIGLVFFDASFREPRHFSIRF